MTTWTELRTIALVGTERRPLPESAIGSALDGFTTDLGAEHAALQAAALLGIGRRVSAPIAQTTPPDLPSTATSARSTVDATAPHEAVLLLELMLTGNTGPGTMSDSLLEQWFSQCADHELVVPHRLLVLVLDGATTTSRLRDQVLPVLGTRGRWLATQRDKWSWAVAGAPVDDDGPPQEIDLDELLQLPAHQRDATLIAARAADTTNGRQLIADACAKLDAASRAKVLGCLLNDLTADDEELLEAALDDRSKGVRAVAIELLNGMTTSARSARLARHLEPLIKKGGRRATIDVTYPAPPEGEQLRDLPPTSRGVIEQQWFDALITGTPLSWWEATLGMTPAKIVRAKSKYTNELLGAWSAAALAQHNRAWLEPLFEVTKQPALLAFIGDDAAADAFLVSTKDKTALNKQALLLQAVPGPWTVAFSNAVLAWARTTNDGKGALARVSQLQNVLADRLHTNTQAALASWLDTVRGEEHQALQRALRNVIQQLSFRTSIDKAFS